jgi:hypothetical protein
MNTAAPAASKDDNGSQAKPSDASALPKDVSRAVSEAMRDQKKRQERLRHVQEFLTSPNFIDMKDQPLLTGSDSHELQERRRDLQYRITVVESVVGLLIEEMDVLDRVIADQAKAESDQNMSPAKRSQGEPSTDNQP